MEDLPAWADRIRRERRNRGWSQKELAKRLAEVAARLGVPMPERASLIRSIRNWEAGRCRPRDPYPMLLARVLGLGEEELFAGSWQPYRPAPGEVLDGLLPEGDPVGVLQAGRRIGPGIVAHLAARVHGLRRSDDVLGGGDLIGPVFRELGGIVRLYREGSHDARTGRVLLTVIGECAQIAGWVASDAGRHDTAARTYRLGISAARQAGDRTLESHLLGSLGYQEVNRGRLREGTELTRSAVRVLDRRSPARARALAWDRLAWAHARTGNAQAAMRALGEAGDALAGDDGGETPAYLYWVNPAELQIMEARVYTELRRPLRAVPLLTEVLDRYDSTHARELGLYLSWLAVALVDANEPEEAARTARRMLEVSAGVASARTAERARVVLRRLQPYRDLPEVRDVLSVAGDALQG